MLTPGLDRHRRGLGGREMSEKPSVLTVFILHIIEGDVNQWL